MPRVDDRQTITTLPLPYNDKSPYSGAKDFSPAVRAFLTNDKERHKFKLPPSKVIFIGDVSVGKTTIVNRYCYNKYQGDYKATIGVDFEIESFNILGQNFVLEMWDTAGQERFRCIAQAYYRNAAVIVVVFDMSKGETLDSASEWLHNALVVNEEQRPLIFLVGTKSDLLTEAQFILIETMAARSAEKLKAEYWFVSARTSYQVVELFQRIAALAFDRSMLKYIEQKDNKRKNAQANASSCNLRDSTASNRGRCAC